MPELRYVKDKRRGQLSSEQEISERVSAWRKGGRHRVRERVISVTGWPGIGKTILLKYVAEKEKGVFIDLEDRGKYRTYVEFIDAVKDEITSGPKRPLICLDGVPGVLTDDYLKAFEGQILQPYLEEEKAFLIMALQDPNKLCWTRLSLGETMVLQLECLDQRGTEELLRKEGCSDRGRIKDIFWYSDGHPFLAICLWESFRDTADYIEGIERFLDFWIKRVLGPSSSVKDELLTIAEPLSLLSEPAQLNDTGLVGKVLEECGIYRVRSDNAISLLHRVRWVEYRPYGPQKRYAPHWVRPVRQCLELLFSKENPDCWNKVREISGVR